LRLPGGEISGGDVPATPLSARKVLRPRKAGAVVSSCKDRYEELYGDVEAVLEGETDPVAWMATISCLIRARFGFLWVGFYRLLGDELVVGPYQGSLGCLRISLGKGVCGTCAVRRKTIVVPDVHRFPGHIACDPRSRSEIVVPVFDAGDRLRAVMDIDSERKDAFGGEDAAGLEKIVTMMRRLRWTDRS
jgi:L-methionine (R)-S-oxide reductase